MTIIISFYAYFSFLSGIRPTYQLAMAKQPQPSDAQIRTPLYSSDRAMRGSGWFLRSLDWCSWRGGWILLWGVREQRSSMKTANAVQRDRPCRRVDIKKVKQNAGQAAGLTKFERDSSCAEFSHENLILRSSSSHKSYSKRVSQANIKEWSCHSDDTRNTLDTQRKEHNNNNQLVE